MRGSFWAARIHLNLPSRHKKRPKSLKVPISLTNRSLTVELPIEAYPSILLLPYYNTPFALRTGDHKSDKRNLFGMWHHAINYDQSKLNEAGAASTVAAQLNLWSFGKMLAKIGHAFAIGAIGLDRFKPLLLKTILDEAVDPHELVGGSPDNQRATPGALHQITLRILEYPDRDLVVSDIQLFSIWGAPLYHVVAGEAPKGALSDIGA